MNRRPADAAPARRTRTAKPPPTPAGPPCRPTAPPVADDATRLLAMKLMVLIEHADATLREIDATLQALEARSAALADPIAVPEESYLTPAQVGELLSISIKTVARMIEMGDLPSIKVGGRLRGGLRIPRSALDAYLAARVRTPGNAA